MMLSDEGFARREEPAFSKEVSAAEDIAYFSLTNFATTGEPKRRVMPMERNGASRVFEIGIFFSSRWRAIGHTNNL